MPVSMKEYVRDKFKEKFPDIFEEYSDEKYLFDWKNNTIITYHPKIGSVIEFQYKDDANYKIEVSKTRNGRGKK